MISDSFQKSNDFPEIFLQVFFKLRSFLFKIIQSVQNFKVFDKCAIDFICNKTQTSREFVSGNLRQSSRSGLLPGTAGLEQAVRGILLREGPAHAVGVVVEGGPALQLVVGALQHPFAPAVGGQKR